METYHHSFGQVYMALRDALPEKALVFLTGHTYVRLCRVVACAEFACSCSPTSIVSSFCSAPVAFHQQDTETKSVEPVWLHCARAFRVKLRCQIAKYPNHHP